MNRPEEASEFPAPTSVPEAHENAHSLGVFLLRQAFDYGLRV